MVTGGARKSVMKTTNRFTFPHFPSHGATEDLSPRGVRTNDSKHFKMLLGKGGRSRD
jgi:hypothetical protein